MLSNLAVVALAAAGAVNAGPLQRRQDSSSAVSSATEAASSVASEASSVASAATSSAAEATSAAGGNATSAASAATSTGAESSAASSSAAATSGATAGNNTFPLYPCPEGFLLTYASVNQTVQLPVTQVTQAVGEWANSTLFPNVTDPTGGNDAGATHTINVGNISLPEVLVSYSTNETSGSAIWNWNGSLTEPVSAMGVSLSNYSTVLQIYDPEYSTSGSIGNTTFINLFTNACANPQAEAQQLLLTLGGLELSNAAAALGGMSGGNSTTGGETSSSAAPSSSAEMTASSAASGASSTAAEATSTAASAASSAESGASSVASEATSAAGSAVSSAESAVSTSSA